MTQFIESLYRLCKEEKVSNETLKKMLISKKISKQEYEYIVSAKNAT